VSGCTAATTDGGVPSLSCRGDADCPDDTSQTTGCVSISTVCASTGVEERTITRWECLGGTCESRNELQSIPCTVDSDGATCAECGICQSSECTPATGPQCFVDERIGVCGAGACCTGCWDGEACQPGFSDDACGEDGEPCDDCRSGRSHCTASVTGWRCR
jgi:hypothetical protein